MATDLAVLSDTYTEKLNQWGLLLSVCTYGAHVALFTRCLWSFWTQSHRRYSLVAYTILLFALATTAIALQIWWTQVAFIDHRFYPGGPQRFLLDNYLSGPNGALTTVYVAMNWLADGLILYRFYVLCGCTILRSRWVALLSMMTCFAALPVIYFTFFRNIASLGINLWTNSPSITPGIAYMAVSLSVNTILTLLIICRICIIRSSLRRAIVHYDNQTYTSVIALLIESAALYTIVALMTVIACGLGSPIQYALLPMLGQLQAIPPVLITSRVAEGLALSKRKYSELQSVQFRNIHITTSRYNTDLTTNTTLPYSPAPDLKSRFSTCSSLANSPISTIPPALKLDVSECGRHFSWDFGPTSSSSQRESLVPSGTSWSSSTLFGPQTAVERSPSVLDHDRGLSWCKIEYGTDSVSPNSDDWDEDVVEAV